MKRIILIFCILVPVFVSANDVFYCSGEFSYFEILEEIDKTDIWDDDNLEFYTSVLVGFEYSLFYAEAEMNTYMVKAESYMFQPYTQEYLARFGVKYKFVKVQLEHLCAHSIDRMGDNYGHNKVSIMFDSRGYK